MKKIIQIFLTVFISFGIIGGCGGGGDDGLYVGGGGGFRQEVNCKKAFDNDRAFCSSFNTGVCCEHYNCSFFSCSTSCAPELGLCCGEQGYNLCPFLNICVTDINQCPGETNPLYTGISISEVEDSFCPESIIDHNIIIHGIAYGPVGTEVKVYFPDFPEITQYVSCWDWGEFFSLKSECIREEGNSAATSWYFSFPQGQFIDRPAPEFDIIFYTDNSSVTFTQKACPYKCL